MPAFASNCTGTGTPSGGNPFSIVVTSSGFLADEPFNQTSGVATEGFAVKQGSSTCTNAGVNGTFGFETTGVSLAGAPATGPVALIGELKLSVNTSGDGVISGHIAGSKGGTIFTFAKEPVTGSYRVNADCRGRATITPNGHSAMHFSLVVADGGKQLMALETDANTVVSGTLVKGN